MKNLKKISASILALVLAIAIILPQAVTPVSALSYSGSSSYRSGRYYRQLTAVKLTGNQRTDIVNVAKSQIGYQEGSSSSRLSGTVRGRGNYTEYGRWYGLQNMWCAMFVSWCANVAKVSTSIVPKHSFTVSGLNWFKARGRAYSRANVAAGKYTPQPGDIIYFKSGRNSNPTNHIGIVTKYSGKTIYTVEGNTSSATVSTNGGAVASKSYSIYNKYIVYICRPNYSGSNISSSSSSTSSSSNVQTPVNFGNDFFANISFKKTGQNLSLSDRNVITYGASEAEAQRWRFVRQSDGSYKILNCKNGMALDVQDGSKSNGANVQIWTSNNNAQQFWFIYSVKGGYVLKPKHAQNMALDVKNGSTAAGTRLQLWAYSGNSAEIFNIIKCESPMKDLGANFTARIKNTNSNLYIAREGDQIMTAAGSGNHNQYWHFVRQADGFYKIASISSENQYLDVAHGASANGTVVKTWTKSDVDRQLFSIHAYGDAYVIKPKHAQGQALDVRDGSKSAGAGIQLWSCYVGAAQLFKIEIGAPISDTSLSNNFYARIVNKASGKNLARNGETGVAMYDIANWNSHIWRFNRQNDGSYEIVNVESGKLLDVTGGNIDNGSAIATYYDVDSAAQRWYVYNSNGAYILKPQCAMNASIDVTNASTDNGAAIQLWGCHSGASQLFNIVKVAGTIASVGNNINAKITAKASGLNLSLSEDRNVIIYTPSSAAAQVWNFVRQSNGFYKIINTKNGKCMDVQDGSKSNGANIQIWDSNNNDQQLWSVYDVDGAYVICPKHAPTMALDVKNASKVAGTRIQLWTQSYGSNQLFTITKQ